MAKAMRQRFEKLRAERDAQIRPLREQGLFPAQIAEQLGLSLPTVRRSLKRLGLQVKPQDCQGEAYRAFKSRSQKRAAITRYGDHTERDAEIVRLRQSGLYPFQIAHKMGLPAGPVTRVLGDHGLSMTPEEFASAAFSAARRAARRARQEAEPLETLPKVVQVAQLLNQNWSMALIAMKLRLRRGMVAVYKYRAGKAGLLSERAQRDHRGG